MSNRAPAFLNKPIHKGTVVATARGWVVEETGELLVSVKNLDQKISEYLGSVIALTPPVLDEVVAAPVIAAPVVQAPVAADVTALLDSLTDAGPTPNAVVEAPADVAAPVADAVAEAAPEAPVVVKKKLGRPPKVRTPEEQAVIDAAAQRAAERAAAKK